MLQVIITSQRLCDVMLAPNESRRSTQYHWDSEGCNLEPFSASRFCSHVVSPGRPRELLLVGDSYMGQLFISLLALLNGAFWSEHMPIGRNIATGGYVHDVPTQEFRVDGLACLETGSIDALRNWWTERKGSAPVEHPVKRPPLWVKFIRNEFMTINRVEPQSANRHEYPWLHAVKPNTLLVLQVSFWWMANLKTMAHHLHPDYSGFEGSMTKALNESAKRIGGRDWAKQVIIVSRVISTSALARTIYSRVYLNFAPQPHTSTFALALA